MKGGGGGWSIPLSNKKHAILKLNFHRKYIATHGKQLSSGNLRPPENTALLPKLVGLHSLSTYKN